MKIPLSILYFSIFFTLLSCQQQGSEEQVLHEVLEIHDEVMPEMQTIFQLRKELISKRDSLEEAGGNPNLINDVEMRIDELSNAHEDMMQWMREFDKNFEGDENTSRIEYLQMEREKIEDVKVGFKLAIENAKTTLSNLSS